MNYELRAPLLLFLMLPSPNGLINLHLNVPQIMLKFSLRLETLQMLNKVLLICHSIDAVTAAKYNVSKFLDSALASSPVKANAT
jgi:hypothetical protein